MFRSFSACLVLGLACVPAIAQQPGATDGPLVDVGNIDWYSPANTAVIRALNATRYIGAVVCGIGFEQDAIKVMDNSNLFEWIWSIERLNPQLLDSADTGAIGDLLSSTRCDASKLPQLTRPHAILESKNSTWKRGRNAYKLREAGQKEKTSKASIPNADATKGIDVLQYAAHLLTASAMFVTSYQQEQSAPLSSVQAAPIRTASASLTQAQLLVQMAASTLESYAALKSSQDPKQ